MSRVEHDEALGSVCNLCLQRMSHFEAYSTVILNDVMPGLHDLQKDYVFRFFGVGFHAFFGIGNQDMCMRILVEFIHVLAERKARTVRFPPHVIREGVCAVNIMIAAFPLRICAREMCDEVESLIDVCLSSRNPQVMFAALETVLIICESLDLCEGRTDELDETDVGQAKGFSILPSKSMILISCHLELARLLVRDAPYR